MVLVCVCVCVCVVLVATPGKARRLKAKYVPGEDEVEGTDHEERHVVPLQRTGQGEPEIRLEELIVIRICAHAETKAAYTVEMARRDDSSFWNKMVPIWLYWPCRGVSRWCLRFTCRAGSVPRDKRVCSR
jgi:hypothetical protein